MDDLLPFQTYDRSDLSWTRDQQRQELIAHQQREDLLYEVMTEQRNLEDFLDCLASQGISPDQWLTVTADNLNYVMDSGIVYTPHSSGLLLPQGF